MIKHTTLNSSRYAIFKSCVSTIASNILNLNILDTIDHHLII